MSDMSATNIRSHVGGSGEPDSDQLNAGRSFSAAVIALVIISVAVYLNTLQNGFVYDDAWQVVRNSWIRDVRFIPDIFASDVWRFTEGLPSNYYRPMMHLLFMLVYHVSGLDPRAFHALNILLNSLACIMVFMITVRLLHQFRPSTKNTTAPAFAAAVLFATHPIHTEAVAWIAAVPELSYSLFCLLSFYLYMRSREGMRAAYALSVLAFLLAAFCKEPALLFPMLLIAYDHFLGRETGKKLVKIRRYAPFIAAAAVYLAARVAALGIHFQPGQNHALNVHDLIINLFPLFGAYLQKMLLPISLNAYTVFEPISSLWTMKGIAAVMMFALFIMLLVISFKKNPIVFLGLMLVAVPLLPSLYIPALPENIFAERSLYLPAFGFVLFLSPVLLKLGDQGSQSAYGVGLLVLAVAILYSIGTVRRNAVWKDDVAFYTEVLKRSPDVAMMHVNLGWTYYTRGRINEALDEYDIALKLKPDLAEAHNNIGLVYARQNRTAEALKKYRTALDLKPDYAAAHNNLGNAYVQLDLIDQAIREFQTALQLSPRFTTAHYNLANAYARNGSLLEAVSEYRTAIEHYPYDADAHNNLGVAYRRLNRFDEANAEFEAALKLNPRYLPARQNLRGIVPR